MNRLKYIACVALTLALLGGAAKWCCAPAAQVLAAEATDTPVEKTLPAPAEIVPFAPPKYLGARSCAATACHGSAEPDTRAGRIGRNEYVYWFEHDPHARAYRALTAPRGQAMLTRLGIMAEGKVVDEAGYKNCLACHNLEPPDRQRGENFFATEGVGCEACHGGAERWIAEHHRAPLSADQKKSLGMTATESLSVRAELCVRCHVGSDKADVNHDLIAAGHPPLKFELAAYCEIYPKHWNERAERHQTADYELQLWLQGKFAAQRAALAVQAGRAKRAADKVHPGPWPEFANYDCFACHHDLNGQADWRTVPAAGSPKIIWPAQRWYSAGFSPSPADYPLQKSYGRREAELAEILESSLSPNPAEVVKAATAAGVAWEKVVSAWPKDVVVSRKLIRDQLVAHAANEATLVSDWDTATQNYLQLAAYIRTLNDEAEKQGGARANAQAEALTELRRQLAFPPHYDSPQQFGGPLEGAKSSRAEVRDRFRGLLRSLP